MVIALLCKVISAASTPSATSTPVLSSVRLLLIISLSVMTSPPLMTRTLKVKPMPSSDINGVGDAKLPELSIISFS